jgi:aryl-alcohol dehydrogenase-like predicted oxidoreductase
VTDTSPASAAGTVSIGGDLTVNRLGFGAMRITGDGVWGPPDDRDEPLRVLRRAIDLGVQFVDTADSYGPDVSEELIAEALHPYPEGLVIATKGGFLRDGPGRWRPDGRPEHLRAACEGSLRRLRLDRIDLYQFHTPDPAVPFEDSLGALVELREAGKVRHIGLSNVNRAQLDDALRITPVASVQNRYNLTTRGSDDLVRLAAYHGFAFIPWAPLGGRRPSGWKQRVRGAVRRDAPDPVTAIAKRHGLAPPQVILAWLLARSPWMLPIPGTSSVAHLEDNVAAASIELTSDDLAALGD